VIFLAFLACPTSRRRYTTRSAPDCHRISCPPYCSLKCAKGQIPDLDNGPGKINGHRQRTVLERCETLEPLGD